MAVLPKTANELAGVKACGWADSGLESVQEFFSSGEELRQDMVAWCLHLVV